MFRLQAATMDDIDTEIFIERVKTRPEIRNITSEEYKDKKKRDGVWEDIWNHLVSDKEEKERKENGKIFYLLVTYFIFTYFFYIILFLLLFIFIVGHNDTFNGIGRFEHVGYRAH